MGQSYINKLRKMIRAHISLWEALYYEYFIFPYSKSDVAYIYDNYSLRQVLEKMEYHKYSCIPVIGVDGKYVGTITEGDLLWA